MPIDTAPYGASWVNALIDRVERLPGPAWAAYVVVIVPTLLYLEVGDWISGGRIGELKPDRVVWALALVGSTWLIHHLDSVARGAFDDFGPMLGLAAEERGRLEYELTVIPRTPALVILGLAAVRTAEAFAFQPESEGLTGLTPGALALRFPFETLLTALVLILIYHTVRQLRLVGRIHAQSKRINLFRPAPLYAFSRLTSETAIGLALLVIPFGSGLTSASTALDFVTLSSISGLIIGVAVLAFFLPLLGMHGRMSTEKHRLQDEVGQRVEVLVERLHGSVDRDDLTGADGQNKALGSLIAERELVNRLSTWPWQAGTAGAVASAVLLPIVLFLLTRFLDRVL
ncbi:MAG: hypothetical protein ABI573_00915 [Chloroflexota bacterium]